MQLFSKIFRIFWKTNSSTTSNWSFLTDTNPKIIFHVISLTFRESTVVTEYRKVANLKLNWSRATLKYMIIILTNITRRKRERQYY